jgi:hypothetical protein
VRHDADVAVFVQRMGARHNKPTSGNERRLY